jgi:Holliday junction resolvase RusA-like endonuclease
MDAPLEPGHVQRFIVYGKPVAQGDLSAMPVMKRGTREPVMGRNGRPIVNMVHQNAAALKPWRQEIAGVAVAEGGWLAVGLNALDGPVYLSLTFYVKRPESHYGTGRNAGVLKDSAPLHPETSGSDIDKLTRAVLDALTGIVWKDDKRVVVAHAKRRYGSPERVEIVLRRPRVRTVGELRRLRELEPVRAEGMAEDLQLDLFSRVKDPDQGQTAPSASSR